MTLTRSNGKMTTHNLIGGTACGQHGGSLLTRHPKGTPMFADRSRAFLILISLGLAPVALSYGLAPEKSLPWLFGIDASGVNLRHILRGVMGLYLAMICFWIAGAVLARLRVPALWSLVVFMTGLGLGRLFSLIVDGWPHPLLVVYLVLEVAIAGIGIRFLRAAA